MRGGAVNSGVHSYTDRLLGVFIRYLPCMDDVIERLERLERPLMERAAQPRYVDTRQASELTGVSVVTLERWRVAGGGPPT